MNVIDTTEIKNVLTRGLSLQEAHVSAQGSHFEVILVSNIFATMKTVQKHRAVYTQLNEYIVNGSIHALSIKAYTPEEWKRNCKFHGF